MKDDQSRQETYPVDAVPNLVRRRDLVTRAVWEAEADRRRLDPGPAGIEDDRRPDVLVVGGGVVGLATAALCRRAGLGRVLLLERGRLAAGPSGSAAGVLAPDLHHWSGPAALVELGRASLALWRRLDREWAGALGLEPLDVVHPLPAGAAPPFQPPPGARLLTPGEARALAPPLPAGSGGLLIGGQARLPPLRLAAALARRAGTVATGVEVLACERTAAGLRVRSSHGDLYPGAVVLATGVAPSLPGVPRYGGGGLVKGLLIATEPAPFRLRAALQARGGLVLQLPDGRLLFGNTFDPEDSSPLVRPEAVAATLADLAAVLPEAGRLAVRNAWCCFRPATADRLPVIDRLDELGAVWVSHGHFRTGILMAAATGQALAAWIAAGARPAGLEPFAAARPGVS